ncbi:MAG: hypothetical protein KF887_05915 [Paracoccaceae bacterium]|nr:MAG: hypothetical protein KF887_05915 [Paracoccaceae bacterium]
MRVIEETAERLVLVHRPWLMGLGLAVATLGTARIALALWSEGDLPGTLMIGAGAVLCAVAFAVFVRPARAVFDRRAGTVEVTEWTVTGTRRRGAPLAQVTGATISRGRDTMKPGAARGALAVVSLREGALPLGSAYLGYRPASRAVAAVQRWLGPV